MHNLLRCTRIFLRVIKLFNPSPDSIHLFSCFVLLFSAHFIFIVRMRTLHFEIWNLHCLFVTWALEEACSLFDEHFYAILNKKRSKQQKKLYAKHILFHPPAMMINIASPCIDSQFFSFSVSMSVCAISFGKLCAVVPRTRFSAMNIIFIL